jgi:hypothetical protein
MSTDPIGVYRAELRSAAARRAGAYGHRRRSAVALAVAVGAVLLVGGAVASQQTRWFDSGARMELRFTAAARAAALGSLTRGYVKCLAAHRSTDAASACASLLDAMTATCLMPRVEEAGRGVLRVTSRVSPAQAAACVAAERRRAAVAR